MTPGLKRICGIAVVLSIASGSIVLVAWTIRDHQSARKATTAVPYDPRRQAAAMRRHNDLKAAAPISRPGVLFIGDSLTERWKAEGRESWKGKMLHLSPFNAGIDNDRTENLLWRIRNGGVDFAQPPKACVLLIGINNLAADGDTPHGVARGVEAVARELLERFPDSRIIVLGLLPSGEYSNTLVGRRVRTNRKLQDIHLPSTTYLDVSDAFLNSDGGAKSGLTTDGLHLSAEGYKMLADCLIPELEHLTGLSSNDPH